MERVDKSKFTDKREKVERKRILVSWILKIKLGVMDSWVVDSFL